MHLSKQAAPRKSAFYASLIAPLVMGYATILPVTAQTTNEAIRMAQNSMADKNDREIRRASNNVIDFYNLATRREKREDWRWADERQKARASRLSDEDIRTAASIYALYNKSEDALRSQIDNFRDNEWDRKNHRYNLDKSAKKLVGRDKKFFDYKAGTMEEYRRDSMVFGYTNQLVDDCTRVILKNPDREVREQAAEFLAKSPILYSTLDAMFRERLESIQLAVREDSRERFDSQEEVLNNISANIALTVKGQTISMDDFEIMAKELTADLAYRDLSKRGIDEIASERFNSPKLSPAFEDFTKGDVFSDVLNKVNQVRNKIGYELPTRLGQAPATSKQSGPAGMA